MNMKRFLIGLLASLFASAALANTCTVRQAGATDQTVYVTFVDSTTGVPNASRAYNDSGIDLEYVRAGAAAVDITEATQTAAGAHSDGGFVSVGHGRYRLDLPDAAVASGVPEVIVQGVITGYVMLPCSIELNASIAQTGDSYALMSNARFGIIETGTAQAGASGNIQLASAVSRADNFLNCATVTLTGGTGAGQSRVIDAWTSATDTGTVTVNWTTAPSSDSTYVVFQTPCGAGGLTAAQVVDEFETQSQADPTGFHVNVLEIGGTAQTANDNGADINAILVDTGTTLDGKLDTIDNFLDTEIAAILALLDDARTEPGQGAPPVNPDLATKIDYLYKAWRNKSEQTATEYRLLGDDASTVHQKATFSDDATTATRGEMATGP
jgi:hypothetical protein